MRYTLILRAKLYSDSQRVRKVKRVVLLLTVESGVHLELKFPRKIYKHENLCLIFYLSLLTT